MPKNSRLFTLIASAAMAVVIVPPARPQTPAPAPPQAPPGFDLAFAMNALYGDYDAANGTSTSAATVSGPEFMNFPAGQKITVKPFFAAASSITGEVFIATYSVPATGEFDCHACAPLLGLAVFQKSGTTWKIEASEKPDIIFGQYGNPPTAQLFQFGERHIGIQLNNTDGGQGVLDTLVMLLVSWNGGFSQAWSGLVSSDDSMYCGRANNVALLRLQGRSEIREGRESRIRRSDRHDVRHGPDGRRDARGQERRRRRAPAIRGWKVRPGELATNPRAARALHVILEGNILVADFRRVSLIRGWRLVFTIVVRSATAAAHCGSCARPRSCGL